MNLLVYLRDGRTVYLLDKRGRLHQLVTGEPWHENESVRVVPAGLTDAIVYDDLVRACRDAGVAHYTPHDLRHRRISLWIRHGIDVVTVATWAGHTSLDIDFRLYGHVIVAGADEWRDFWLYVYASDRRLADRTRERSAESEGR